MQTFLPYKEFDKSAKVLDYRRLGKQRVECYQILQTLRGESSGWANHPAVKMWVGFEAALAEYSLAICAEWVSRGYRDSCAEKIKAFGYEKPTKYPPWIGDEEFHTSHKSNLLRKDNEFYGKYGWDIPADLPYVWPQIKNEIVLTD